MDEEIVYGENGKDEWFIVKVDERLYVVHDHFFNYENAILFAIGGDDKESSDWSDNMLLETAKTVVDQLNSTKYYPDGSK